MEVCHFPFIYQWMHSTLENQRVVLSHLKHLNLERENMGGVSVWVLGLQEFTEFNPLSVLYL